MCVLRCVSVNKGRSPWSLVLGPRSLPLSPVGGGGGYPSPVTGLVQVLS